MDEKLTMQTRDLREDNVEAIARLFPSCVTEATSEDGSIHRLIDFEALKRQLSGDIIPEGKERYVFTWPGKSEAQRLANIPSTLTLRPCREKSVDFDNTKNIYIEGDNLDALKLLRETYLGKVKMIYIDPPYNTGNDFVYNDDFTISAEGYLHISGDLSDSGDRLVLNPDSNGRFHTDWLNMIYPRIMLSRDYLSEDGAIFISIDDREYPNIVKVCDELYGSNNRVGTIIWERAFAPKNDAKFISSSHDYIVIYAKNINKFEISKLPRTEEANARYKNLDNDPRGPWASDNLTVKTYSEAYDYEIISPSGKKIKPTAGRCWFTNKKRMDELIADNRIWFGEDGNNTPRLKRFLSEVQDGMVPTSIWKYEEVGHNQEGRQELKKLFSGKGYFDGPKPTKLMLKMMKIANLKSDSIVLDFFSGSGTTADALLKYNQETGKDCKFILVQLPEACPEQSQAFKDGFKTICNLGTERIRLIGKMINANIDGSLVDTGFRVFKIDSSNMNDVFYDPRSLKKDILDYATDNIKSDRTGEDLSFQVMLELGIELSAPISKDTINSKEIFFVDSNYLIACFDQDIDDDIVTTIADRKPYYAVFRDSSMSSDAVAINFNEIFKTYSPNTITKVL